MSIDVDANGAGQREQFGAMEGAHMILKFIAAVFLLLPSTISLAQQDEEINRVPGSTITEAKWSDYKDMYDSSPLCGKEEMTLWTCEANKKRYSLCSSRTVTRNSGYIQYRVSEAGHPTFFFPDSKTPPFGIFSYQSSLNGDASLSFSNGGYEYSLADPLRGKSFITVTADSPQSRSVEIPCKSGGQTLQINYTMRLMYDAGIWVGY